MPVPPPRIRRLPSPCVRTFLPSSSTQPDVFGPCRDIHYGRNGNVLSRLEETGPPDGGPARVAQTGRVAGGERVEDRERIGGFLANRRRTCRGQQNGRVQLSRFGRLHAKLTHERWARDRWSVFPWGYWGRRAGPCDTARPSSVCFGGWRTRPVGTESFSEKKDARPYPGEGVGRGLGVSHRTA